MTYPTGTIVRDPDGGLEYTFRPDLNPEEPFYRNGEWFNLAGVDEEVVS